MKKCKRVLGALCMALWGLSGTCALALDNVDADGMPVIYLRGGDIGEVPWGCSESLRFERNGQNYSLHVDRLSGEFKIGTYDFKTFDYGPNLIHTLLASRRHLMHCRAAETSWPRPQTM